MKKVFHKSKTYKDAERWDILQHVKMTPEERQQVAFELKIRVFGSNTPDIRESYPKK